MPVFCDLLTHVAVSLVGDVGIERAAPRLRLLLEATAIGLAQALPPGDGG